MPGRRESSTSGCSSGGASDNDSDIEDLLPQRQEEDSKAPEFSDSSSDVEDDDDHDDGDDDGDDDEQGGGRRARAGGRSRNLFREGEDLIFEDAFVHTPEEACNQAEHGLYALKRFAFLLRKQAEAHIRLGTTVQQVLDKGASGRLEDGAPTFLHCWEVLRQTLRDTNHTVAERGRRLQEEVVNPMLRHRRNSLPRVEALSKRLQKETARVEALLKKVELTKRATEQAVAKTFKEREKAQQGKRSLLSKLKGSGLKKQQDKAGKEAIRYEGAVEAFNEARRIYYESTVAEALEEIQEFETKRLEELHAKLDTFCDVESDALEPYLTAQSHLREAVAAMSLKDDIQLICRLERLEPKRDQHALIMDESIQRGITYELPWSPEDILAGRVD